MKILSIFSLTLLSYFFSVDEPNSKCNKADLAIIEFFEPEWDGEFNQTVVRVIVQNKGKMASSASKAHLRDLDISAETAQAMGLDTIIIEMIAENNARAAYYAENDQYPVDENLFDYDTDVESYAQVPALKKGQKAEVIFYIPNHWVYDSNCELRVIVDEEEKVDDCDRQNNTMDFYGWGWCLLIKKQKGLIHVNEAFILIN